MVIDLSVCVVFVCFCLIVWYVRLFCSSGLFSVCVFACCVLFVVVVYVLFDLMFDCLACVYVLCRCLFVV